MEFVKTEFKRVNLAELQNEKSEFENLFDDGLSSVSKVKALMEILGNITLVVLSGANSTGVVYSWKCENGTSPNKYQQDRINQAYAITKLMGNNGYSYSQIKTWFNTPQEILVDDEEWGTPKDKNYPCRTRFSPAELLQRDMKYWKSLLPKF